MNPALLLQYFDHISKVNELMTLGDQIGTQLIITEADSCCLLEAVWHEDLAPV